MTQILKLSDIELAIAIINMLRILKKKKATFKMSNVSRETETLITKREL